MKWEGHKVCSVCWGEMMFGKGYASVETQSTTFPGDQREVLTDSGVWYQTVEFSLARLASQ